MKDSLRRFVYLALPATLIAGAAVTGCAKSNKGVDVAQDSILVKDADIAGHKTDTAGAATAALVRARGSAADVPTLTSGAPVQRTEGTRGLQPPHRANPMSVLPPRTDAQRPRTSSSGDTSVSTQPSAPTQPTVPPAPKKDSASDSLVVSRYF